MNEMNFSDHFEEVDELLNQVAEFVRIIQEEDNFPDQFFFDVRPSLKRILFSAQNSGDISWII